MTIQRVSRFAVMILMIPVAGWAQTLGESAATSAVAPERWEFTLDGRVGAPIGRLRVGEFPTSGGTTGGTPGTRFRLSDLGIHVSEAVEGSVAFHLTPRDAVRASVLYY